MIRKLIILVALLILPALITACSEGSSGNSMVNINFNGTDAAKSLTDLSTVTKAAGDPVPAAIDTIEIIVTDPAGIVVYDEEFYREEFESTNTLSLEVPSGEDMVFSARGRDITRMVIYTGAASAAVDLAPDSATTVSIIMEPADLPAQDAQLSLSLVGEDGVTTFAAPGYLAGANMIDARVFRPAINETTGIVELGSAIDSNTPGGFVTSITGLLAYPGVYQIVIVRAIAADTGIAAIGSVIISDLASGANDTVTVRMVRPARLLIRNDSAITSVAVQMDFGTGMVEVANTGDVLEVEGTGIGTNQVMVVVPNRVPDIKTGTAEVTPVARDVYVEINGGAKNDTESFTTSDSELKWKTTVVDFSAYPTAVTWSVLSATE